MVKPFALMFCRFLTKRLKEDSAMNSLLGEKINACWFLFLTRRNLLCYSWKTSFDTSV